ncbi:preprotein translocase subunit SecA [Ruminiclostridium cellobioparum]|uniref:preprotein translocase subunit SecA n=1 Tax=Ruminiclostridium cellobioparum TaxID=29355 RepID=UPI0028B11DEA|nr:DEAD/DEAH box helicase [Ruminiclostridium cellobioparum]
MFKKMLKLLARPAEFSGYDKLLEEIKRIELTGLSDDGLKNRVKEFKDKFSAWLTDKYKDCRDTDNVLLNKLLRETAFTDSYLPECYAITKELCRRSFKLEAYDSQLLTGIALHFGNIAELPTGEGKTMAAVFPAVLNALAGKGVHILTFNDYLARRDALWMKSIYSVWGLRVDFIQGAMEAQDRRTAYSADITYMTPKEAGFDFLRDTLVYSPEELVHRPFNYVIVDEADSILIDEARVPLVIAGKDSNEGGSIDKKLVQSIEKLRPEIDYLTDENKRNVFLTDTGISILERELNCGNLYGDNLELLTFINNLLHAKTLLKRDVDYIVRDNRIEIVDEFTGRVADRRKWHVGLQMAVEALEGISYTPNSRILGRITIQNFISLYPEMAGMTATAQSSEEEFLDAYNRRVYVVKPDKKCIRLDYPDEIFTHKAARDRAIIKEIPEVHKSGRPILIGTSSIEESESLAERLQNCRIDCAVLNARNDAEEAEIIANAGKLGAVTVSTNMAGRGVDIKLGDGCPASAETDRVLALGGLYVIGTNKNECIRIDKQLRGRAGRPGDPGASRFFISLEDELLNRFEIRKLLPKKYLGYRQEEKIEDSKLNSLINHIQRVVDGQNFDARKTLGKYSLLLEYQRRLLTKKRDEILYMKAAPLLPASRPELYRELCGQYGAGKVDAVGKRAAIHFIDECWYTFLEYCESVQEGIHLVGATRKVPLDEYRKLVIQEFDSLMNRLEDDMLQELEQTDFGVSEADFAARGYSTPAATWTYMINDNIKVKRFSLFGIN